MSARALDNVAQTIISSSRSLELRELQRADLGPLHEMAMEPTVRRRWRTRGEWVDPPRWESFLMAGSSWRAVATERSTGLIVGYAELTDLNLLDGHAQITAFADPRSWRRGLPAEMTVSFMRAAFDRYPLHRLYLVVASDNVEPLHSVARRFPVEGRLVQHLNIDGKWLDSLIIAISRDEFGAAAERVQGSTCADQGCGLARAPGRHVSEVIASGRAITSAEARKVAISDLDSLEILELVVAIEEAKGHLVATELMDSFATVGDAELFAST